MTAIIIGMLLCIAAAGVVVAAVAIPARRQGRSLLTDRGEDVVAGMRERTDVAASRTRAAASRTRVVATRAMPRRRDDAADASSTGATAAADGESTPARTPDHAQS